MNVERYLERGQLPVFWIVSFALVEIGFFIYLLITSRRDGEDVPSDDSNWRIDFEQLKYGLNKFLGNKQERIVGILGKNNVMNNNAYEKGFCFVTDRAYYFIGKVWQKKYFFSWKSNIQCRIVASEMKEIRIRTLYPWKMLLFTAYTVFNYVWNIRLIIVMILVGIRMNLSYDFEEAMMTTVFLLTGWLVVMLIPLIYGLFSIYLKRKTTIDIEFTNQTMRFPINILGKQEIKDFYKAASQIQESMAGERIGTAPQRTSLSGNIHTIVNSVQETVMNKNNAVSNNMAPNKVQRLSELSKLYEQGMLSKEEFGKLKGEIIYDH